MMKYYLEGLTKSFCYFIVITFLFFTPIGLTNEIYITKNKELKISSSSEISKQQEKNIKKEEPKEIKKTVTKVNTVKKETNNTVKNEVKETKKSNRIIIPNVLDKDLMKDLNGDNFYLNNNINGIKKHRSSYPPTYRRAETDVWRFWLR